MTGGAPKRKEVGVWLTPYYDKREESFLQRNKAIFDDSQPSLKEDLLVFGFGVLPFFDGYRDSWVFFL